MANTNILYTHEKKKLQRNGEQKMEWTKIDGFIAKQRHTLETIQMN